MENEIKKNLYGVWLGVCLGFAQIDLIVAMCIIVVAVVLVTIRVTKPLNVFDEYVRNSLYALFLGASLAFAGIGLNSVMYWIIIIGVPVLVSYRHLILIDELEQNREKFYYEK